MVHTAITSNDIDKMKLVYQCAHQVQGSIENFTNRNRSDISIPICNSVDIPVEL